MKCSQEHSRGKKEAFNLRPETYANYQEFMHQCIVKCVRPIVALRVALVVTFAQLYHISVLDLFSLLDHLPSRPSSRIKKSALIAQKVTVTFIMH